ncbi:hypothetical protein JCM8097_002739 [Rhodosporidiobolus ruineniae]
MSHLSPNSARRGTVDLNAEVDALLEDDNLTPRTRRLSNASFTAASHTPRRLFRFVLVFLAVLLLLVFAFVSSPKNKFTDYSLSRSRKTSGAKAQRVFIRAGGFGWEGLGSVIQRFKESIVLAEALGATFLITDTDSEHGYSTSDLINGVARESVEDMDLSHPCSLQDRMWGTDLDRKKIVQDFCERDPAKQDQLKQLAKRLEGCTVILDSNYNEVNEHLNGCIHGWLRERLGFAANKNWDPSRITVGVHIRWGDSAGEFRGSMHLDHVNALLSHLVHKFGSENLDIMVAMEKHDDQVLAKLEVPNYRLVDSGDGIKDLFALANNDVLIAGGSSYAAMAHLLAPRGLSIIEGGHPKYWNTSGFGREVIMLEAYREEMLDRLPALVQGSS